MKTEKQIREFLDKRNFETNAYFGMTYEQGIEAALRYVLEEEDYTAEDMMAENI